MAKICKVCGDVGARCHCYVCSGRMHSACSTIQHEHRVCNHCGVFVKVNPKPKRKHWWKCQKCGITFERRDKSEPKRCPQCLDRGYKSYRGISDRHPDLREKEGFDTPSNSRALTQAAKKPDIKHIRKHWHASEDVMALCMHAEGLEDEVRRLHAFIREKVPCRCRRDANGPFGKPMCERCMILYSKPAPDKECAPIKLKSICTCLTCGATWKPTRNPIPCPVCSGKTPFRYCPKCGMDLLKNWDKHGAYCTFKAGQFAKQGQEVAQNHGS